MTDYLKHDTGYGFLKRSVMRNKNVSIEAKGIYAYLISFAGNGETAFPSRSLICEELDISINRFTKYLNELKNAGLVEVKQERTQGGLFRKNIYHLTDTAQPCIKKPYTENPYTENPYTENPYTENEYTNNNNINNINNNNINNNNINSDDDFKKIIDKWNKLDKNISKLIRIGNNTKRARLLKARISEHGIDGVLKAINQVDKSLFLKGYKTDFVITFDWFVKPENFLKVLEGNYSDKRKTQEKKVHPAINKFHNFKQLSDDYEEGYLESLAKKKRQELYDRLSNK